MRVTRKSKEELLTKAEHKCEYCGVDVNEHTAMVHHKIPLSEGGTSDIENLAISCPKCHILNADKLLGSISNPVVESAAKLWIHAYLKSPIFTTSTTIAVALTAALLSYQVEHSKNKSLEKELSHNQTFKVQIEELNDTEDSLNRLLKFVSSQKEKMSQYEMSINTLELEKQKLEPLVNANKKTVEALFKVQEERAAENASKERWFGFGLGILASVIASVIMVIGRYFIASKRESS